MIIIPIIVVAHNPGSETKRAAGIPLSCAFGQVGSFLGSHLYPLTEGPAYSYVDALASVDATVVVLICNTAHRRGFGGKLAKWYIVWDVTLLPFPSVWRTHVFCRALCFGAHRTLPEYFTRPLVRRDAKRLSFAL